MKDYKTAMRNESHPDVKFNKAQKLSEESFTPIEHSASLNNTDRDFVAFSWRVSVFICAAHRALASNLKFPGLGMFTICEIKSHHEQTQTGLGKVRQKYLY